MCGRLLERRGVSIRPDDENELENRVRTPEAQRDASSDSETDPDA